MRQALNVTVIPEPGTEEMADCNWIPWMVIGHDDPTKIEDIRPLVKEFFTPYLVDPTAQRPEFNWDEWEKVQDNITELFLDFMDTKGYTTFPPARLNWATI